MAANATTNEEEIVRRAGRGDPAAMKSLYDGNVRYLTAVCSRYVAGDEDVKDVLQDAFLRIFSSIGRFEWRGEGSLRAWMTRIVVNESIKLLRRDQRFDKTEPPEEPATTDDNPPDTDAIPAETLLAMIRSLPPGYRTVFNLYVMERKSHKEIASLLDISEGTSASQLHRAKAMLAEKIKRYRSTR